MCLTVTQTFRDCNCTITRHLICSDREYHLYYKFPPLFSCVGILPRRPHLKDDEKTHTFILIVEIVATQSFIAICIPLSLIALSFFSCHLSPQSRQLKIADWLSLDVDSTRKQLGNFPCPKTENRSIEMLQGGCRGSARCKNRMETIWIFDHFSRAHFDFTFLERPPHSLQSLQPTCLNGGFTKVHTCGIGKMVWEHWRHVHEASYLCD